MADIGLKDGPKPFVIVSNNGRNKNLGDYLGARITTTAKPELISIVPLTANDPLVGWVLCDDITLLYPEDLKTHLGGLSLASMMAVGRGLAAALAIN